MDLEKKFVEVCINVGDIIYRVDTGAEVKSDNDVKCTIKRNFYGVVTSLSPFSVMPLGNTCSKYCSLNKVCRKGLYSFYLLQVKGIIVTPRTPSGFGKFFDYFAVSKSFSREEITYSSSTNDFNKLLED